MFKFFAAIILYLVVISTIISFVVVDARNEDVGYISLSGGLEAKRVEFTEIDQYVDTKLVTLGYWSDINNTLVYEGVYPGWNELFLKGLSPNSEGFYVVEYQFNNPQDSRIRFNLQHDGILDEKSYYLTYDEGYLRITEPRINIPILGLLPPDIIFERPISLSGNNQSIKTEFNPNTGEIRVYHNSEYIGDGIAKEPIVTASHYGGIGVFDTYLEITAIIADINIYEEPGVMDLFSMIANVLVYTIDEKYFPFVYNLLLIKLPISILILGVVFWVRGVS